MERRRFVQSTLAVLASTGLALPALAKKNSVRKKGFKVKALENRYKNKIVYGDESIDFKLLSSETEDRLSVFISSNNAKGFGPPLHLHHDFDEFFYVLNGQFIFQLDDEILTLNMGDTIFIPRLSKHAFNCISEKPGSLLVAITPGKEMENYFAEMGKLLNVQGMPDMVKMQALYKTYHSEILGPPLQ
jgi:mannose-6-phosphate isomerase-like protein (cupin superfamily)